MWALLKRWHALGTYLHQWKICLLKGGDGNIYFEDNKQFNAEKIVLVFVLA